MTPPFNSNNLPTDGIIDRSQGVDMSRAAIERRLRTVGRLHKAWQSLRQFKLVVSKPAGDAVNETARDAQRDAPIQT